MIYKVLMTIAMLAVAAGLPAEKRLALLEAKVDKVHEAMLAAKAPPCKNYFTGCDPRRARRGRR